MGFSRNFTTAPAVAEATRRELLGQAMDLNATMWILAACRAGGVRRTAKLPAGGEVAGKVAGTPANFAVGTSEQGSGGACGLSRVSFPTRMGAGDTSTEESGTQPGAGDTSAEGSGHWERGQRRGEMRRSIARSATRDSRGAVRRRHRGTTVRSGAPQAAAVRRQAGGARGNG
jgi:hypothetical protein